MVSWEQGESQRDPITVCKKPHLNDGSGPAFFAFTIFLIPVLLFNLKIIVAAIVVEDMVIPLYEKVAVLINLRLDQVTFFC